MKMVAVSSYEMFVSFYWAKRRYISYNHKYTDRLKNSKSSYTRPRKHQISFNFSYVNNFNKFEYQIRMSTYYI
jgi:hypothetical protein